jgi:hypothetical protein
MRHHLPHHQCGVAIERYQAVYRPHHYREVQADSTRSIIYILPSLGVALGLIVQGVERGAGVQLLFILTQIPGDRNS